MKNKPLTILPVARKALLEAKKSRCNDKFGFVRLGIQSGGCAGISYQLGFDRKSKSDKIIDCEGIMFVIHEEHWPYLEGLTLDHEIDENGPVFRFLNPNAVRKCPCGTSFNIH